MLGHTIKKSGPKGPLFLIVWLRATLPGHRNGLGERRC
jgi:hypothetical protein